jgi:hypothetical protein
VSSYPVAAVGSSYFLTRAEGTIGRRDQIIDIVNQRMRLSESYFTGVRNRLPRLYDMWRGVWTGRFHPHRNNIHLPLIFSAIWADAARKMSTSFGLWPALSFLGYGPDDMSIARKWESLISAQMKDMDLYMKEVDTMVTANLYGVAITQLGWERKKDFRILEDLRTSPITKQLIRTIRKGEIVTFDGPQSEPVDRLDAFPQPGIARGQNMKWFIRRRHLDLDECRLLAKAGVFGQQELDRMIREGGTGTIQSIDLASIKRFQVRTGMDDDSARWMDRYTRPVEIIEMWGYIPSELADDGDTLRVITIANRRYLMRNEPLPFWHKRLPFLFFSPTPDPHYFDAPGKAEVAEKLNIVANRYVNQSLDVGDLIVDPTWFYDRASNLNTRNLFIRPGRFIPVDGDPNAVIAPMQANLANLSVADAKISQMREYVQMATGIHDDVVQGLDSGDRQTAREFLGRREAAGTRLLLESRLYEETYFEPMGNFMVSLNGQFLEAPVEITILGDNATIDPVTQQQISASRVSMDEEDIRMTYSARALGATTALSRTMKQQNIIQLLGAMGTPVGQTVMGQINAVNFWRSIFRDFEIPNVNEIFQTNPVLNGMMQQLGAQTPGQVPTSGQIAGGAQLPMPPAQGVPSPIDIQSMLQPQA